MSTQRQQIIDLLAEEQLNARDLSQMLHIMEKEVYEHLQHIERTIARKGGRLHVFPCRCLICGFVFESRRRMTKPGRCPKCRKGHISMAEFRVDFG